MCADRFKEAREIFVAAVAKSGDQRESYLDEACREDDDLRGEVEELLRFHDAETDGGSELPTPLRPASFLPDAPERIGPYRILQKIGAGGMGEVYEAQQERPLRRRVALKIIKWGMDTEQVVLRFESERQALALMDHPNVARVFDAGATDQGRPFFVMELVKGIPITEFCDESQLALRDRLELFVQVCRGVQHAHQRGVIHRDIKPSNILVTDQDGGAKPKIIDFGVAKATSQQLTEQTVFTELGQWIGTPEYMSPEQAGMTGFDIDTRTDVYSLGVLLYELLVGVQPFDPEELRSSGFEEMRRKICEQDPPRPSTRVTTSTRTSPEVAKRPRNDPPTLARLLRGDLDWIVMKALEKDRNRRYGSPKDLAIDIERHLNDEPVLASPPSTSYRARKFVRRNRVAVSAALLVAFAVVAGILGTTAGWLRARHEAKIAKRVSDAMVSMYGDLNPITMRGGASTPAEILDRAVERVELELVASPLIQARLMTTLGHVFKDLGRYEKARPLLERAAEIRRREIGEVDPDYAMSISVLGDLLSEMRDFEGARRLHEQALAIRRKALGPADPTVAWSLRSLGHIHRNLGEYAAAHALFQESVEILEGAEGDLRHDLTVSLHSLALLAMDSGDFESARELMERCLEIRESILVPDHPDIAECLADYARILFRLGDPERPIVLTARALSIYEEVFGFHHRRTVGTTAQLAVLEFFSGDKDAAVALYSRILDSQRGTDGAILKYLRGFPEFIALEESIEDRLRGDEYAASIP
jgi:non-specific serine/threonine protein kinase/serine/threonine-protein kinase